MGVHDEDTKRYFKNTTVHCVLAPRYGDSKLSWFRKQVNFNLSLHWKGEIGANNQLKM
jgi:phospholipase D1/2